MGDDDMCHVDAMARVANMDEIRGQDPDLFEEVVERNGYGVTSWDAMERVILDVGANNGCFSLMCAGLGASVLAVEPHPDNYARLVANAAGCPLVTSLMCAVAGEMGVVTLRGSGVLASSSGYGPGGDDREVRAVTLEWLVQMMGDGDNFLMKCDCEGAEYEFLFSARGRDLRRFSTIMMELHKVGSEPTNTLLDYLGFMGFSESWSQPIYSWTHAADGTRTGVVLPGTEVKRLDRN